MKKAREKTYCAKDIKERKDLKMKKRVYNKLMRERKGGYGLTLN